MNETEPYAMSSAGGMAPLSPAAALERKPLYRPGSVALATVFGGPLGGYWVMALNDRRMGKDTAAWKAIAAGVLLSALLIAMGLFFGSELQYAGLGISAAMIPTLYRLAKQSQGEAIEEHVAAGGRTGSGWAAFGIGLVSCALVLAAGLLAVYAQTAFTPSVQVGTNDKVTYSGSATRADAEALGQTLRADGFFQDKGVVVRLSKGGDGTIVAFSVKDGMWDNTQYVSNIQEFGREIAPAVGGLPLTVRLLDASGQTERDIPVVAAVGN